MKYCIQPLQLIQHDCILWFKYCDLFFLLITWGFYETHILRSWVNILGWDWGSFCSQHWRFFHHPATGLAVLGWGGVRIQMFFLRQTVDLQRTWRVLGLTVRLSFQFVVLGLYLELQLQPKRAAGMLNADAGRRKLIAAESLMNFSSCFTLLWLLSRHIRLWGVAV